MGFFDFMTEDIAIDLGTANTLIIHNDKVVFDSPSIVARDRISAIEELSTFIDMYDKALGLYPKSQMPLRVKS
jgi:actin-like ATPase involved in cell morphogenesis